MVAGGTLRGLRARRASSPRRASAHQVALKTLHYARSENLAQAYKITLFLRHATALSGRTYFNAGAGGIIAKRATALPARRQRGYTAAKRWRTVATKHLRMLVLCSLVPAFTSLPYLLWCWRWRARFALGAGRTCGANGASTVGGELAT